MGSGIGESTSVPRQNSSCSGNIGNDAIAGDFECNICFEVAQDPIVTLCGHLFCWPCLYRWLHHHSQCQECPVCKALIQEEKLVPLYGRGQALSDPRSKSYPGTDIPHRPVGLRPQITSPLPDPTRFNFSSHGFGLGFGFGFMGGFMPMMTARIRNFTFATAFGGLIPPLFNIQFQGFQDATVYGQTSGFPNGFHTFHGGHAHHRFHQQTLTSRVRQADNVLKNIFMLISIFVIIALLCW